MKKLVSTLLLGLSLSGAAYADYPEKPITFVVPFAAGTATDQLARALGQAVTEGGCCGASGSAPISCVGPCSWILLAVGRSGTVHRAAAPGLGCAGTAPTSQHSREQWRVRGCPGPGLPRWR